MVSTATENPIVTFRTSWSCGIFVVLVPFLLQYNFILNSFYQFGAPYFDAGLFAHVLWHNDWLIANPHAYGDFSYLLSHFTPVLMLTNQLSYFAPTQMVEYFAAFMACIYTSLALAMYYTLLTCVRPRGLTKTAALALLAIGFAFNGVLMHGIWLPHFEYAIPAGIFLFLVHYKLDHKYWAAFFLAFTLLLREDAGFHLTAVIGLLAAADYLRTRSFAAVKSEAWIIAISCGYSVFAWRMTFYLHSVYGVDGSIFSGMYSGTPPYAHLTGVLLSNRLHVILTELPYLWVGLLVSLGWAIYRHNVYWAIGFAAYIPWFIFNFTAYNENTGELYAYYAFPFMLSMGWPFIAVLWRYGRAFPHAAVREALTFQAMLVLVGLVVWNVENHHLDFGPAYYSSRWGSFRLQSSVENRASVREFAENVKYSPDLGVMMVDYGMLSLTMGSVAQNQGVNDLRLLTDDNTIDSLAYFHAPGEHTPEPVVADQIRKNKLSFRYSVIGTSIYVFTNHAPAQLGSFAALLTPRPSSPDAP